MTSGILRLLFKKKDLKLHNKNKILKKEMVLVPEMV
jgi:hypothetical protein